jgi:hypothetical protein
MLFVIVSLLPFSYNSLVMPDQAIADSRLTQDASSETIRVQVELRRHDVYTPFTWTRGNVVRWVAAGLLCYIFYDLFTRGSDSLRSFPEGDSILAVAVLLAVLILCGLLLFPYLRMRAAFRKNSYFRQRWTYTFSSESLRIQSDDSTTECKWTVFSRIAETPKVFMLFYAGRGGGAYLPKRCIASREELLRLRDLFRAKRSERLKVQLRPD